MFKDLTPSAAYMGLLAAFVGYTASFTIVLSGLTAAGASPGQAATGLFFATLAMGLCSIYLPMLTKSPAAVAWSTPGAAFLASTAALPGGFAEAIGAMILCAGLLLITGLIPVLGRLVASVPKPIANALLAGVLFNLCLAPAIALGSIPALVIPVLVAWLVGMKLHRLAAMPAAVFACVVVLAFVLNPNDGGSSSVSLSLPAFELLTPIFTVQGLISVAIPLYLVTMAGQNIPGFAVLELNGYTVNRQRMLRTTGLASMLTAPFGAVPVNMSAITAAMMSGEDAGKDPTVRYWAASISGFAYVALALIAAPVAALAALAPPELNVSVAGLALIPALVASLSAAFSTSTQIEAPALTFLIAASGMVLFGISGAFWALIIGLVVWIVRQEGFGLSPRKDGTAD